MSFFRTYVIVIRFFSVFVKINNNIRLIVILLCQVVVKIVGTILVIGRFTYFVFTACRFLSLTRLACQE